MKTFVIVLIACVVGGLASITDEQKAKIREHRLTCVAETGVSAEALENAKKGILDEADPKLACFAACFLKKLGFVNADGAFDEATFRARVLADIPKEKVDEIVNKCKDITGVNACETGSKLFKCSPMEIKYYL